MWLGKGGGTRHQHQPGTAGKSLSGGRACAVRVSYVAWFACTPYGTVMGGNVPRACTIVPSPPTLSCLATRPRCRAAPATGLECNLGQLYCSALLACALNTAAPLSSVSARPHCRRWPRQVLRSASPGPRNTYYNNRLQTRILACTRDHRLRGSRSQGARAHSVPKVVSRGLQTPLE